MKENNQIQNDEENLVLSTIRICIDCGNIYPHNGN